MKKKRALITGVTGMVGSFLSEILLAKDYLVYGMVRRAATPSTSRIAHLLNNPSFKLLDGDLLDQSSLIRVVTESSPDEVFNCAANSFVGVSWQEPLSVGDVTGLGVARMLEALRIAKPDTKFVQCSTSEMYGRVQETPQRESTPFYPRSPYGCAKLYGYWMVVNYRESYDMFTSSAIMFNNESPRRGLEFVTRKITNTLAKIHHNLISPPIQLGNLDSKRDWGWSPDYAEGLWKILQADKPSDYVLATGETHSVREFVEKSFEAINKPIIWRGEGVDEIGVCQKSNKTMVSINPKFYRPAEVDLLLGDASKIQEELGWSPTVKFEDIVSRMIEADLELVGNGSLF